MTCWAPTLGPPGPFLGRQLEEEAQQGPQALPTGFRPSRQCGKVPRLAGAPCGPLCSGGQLRDSGAGTEP